MNRFIVHLLPGPQWNEQTRDDTRTIHICKIQASSSSTRAPVVTHSITIHANLTWTATVHGHKVHSK